MNKAFLRQLVKCFGFLAETLPEDYKPAARAFLFSLTNDTPDCERPVPQEILPTLAYAVSRAAKKSRFYTKAKIILNTHTEPVLVQKWDYPRYSFDDKISGYNSHPHYFVLGGFTATPVGDGFWLVEDRYDWHFPDYWRVPDVVAEKVPGWVLAKVCEKGEDGWYLDEVGTLSKWSVPYWHRSVIKLSDYLDPKHFQ